MRLIDADKLKEYVNSKSTHPLCEWDAAGVLMAIDEQETIENKWISVSERLPTQTDEYLCTVEWYGSSNRENLVMHGHDISKRVMIVHFLASNKSFKEHIDFCNYKVIAWMPKPECY